jgi:hypothetical protein
MPGFQIVLFPAEQNKDAVSDAFARSFGIDLTMSRQIADMAPIIVLDRLGEEQSQNIVSALHLITAAGGVLLIDQDQDNKYPKIHWPAPPAVGGRSLDAFRGPAGAADMASAAEAAVTCPCCGAELRVSLAAQQSGSGPVRVPERVHLAAATPPPVPAAHKPPSSAVRSAEHQPPFAAALPEVPVVSRPGEPRAEAPTPGTRMAAAPMALEDFEAAFAPRSTRPPSSHSMRVLREGTGTFSVYVPQTENPRLPQLISKLRGLTIAEAVKVAQKPIIQLVRDVPFEDAEAVRRLLTAANINARVQDRQA